MRWARADGVLHASEQADLTYVAHGTTDGTVPDGYRAFRGSWSVGRGLDDFVAAGAAVGTWEMHRGAGLRVLAPSPTVQLGAVVVLGVGVSEVRILAPCRVVRLVEEDRRTGFAYGTLPGHPVCGEELFEVVYRDDGDVVLEVTSFSRPGTWYARAGGPLSHLAQDLVTRRYVRAVRAAVNDGAR